jgi:hypothetical protein
MSPPSSSGPIRPVRLTPQFVQFLAGGDCFAATVGRLLLQSARANRLDIELHLGRMGPRVELVGKRFLSPQSQRVLGHLVVDCRSFSAEPRVSRLGGHDYERAGEYEYRDGGNDDQNYCVGRDVGPLDR